MLLERGPGKFQAADQQRLQVNQIKSKLLVHLLQDQEPNGDFRYGF